MLKRGIRQLRNYAYAYTFRASNRDTTCYRLNALLYARMMWSDICYQCHAKVDLQTQRAKTRFNVKACQPI